MKNVSVVCCYNDKEMYDRVVVKMLKKQQEIEYELIGIDNTNGEYRSAASAINYAIKNSMGEVIVVIHQDFKFLYSDALKKLYNYSIAFRENDILGVAGAVLDINASILKKLIGRNRMIIAALDGEYTMMRFPTQVDSLDECCFVFRRSYWEKYPLDELTCDKWDLYAVDMCLQARLLGGKSYVLPVDAVHYSGGKLSKNFYTVLKKLSNKYKGKISKIVTTCVVTSTRFSNFEYIKLIGVNRIRRWKNEGNNMFSKS